MLRNPDERVCGNEADEWQMQDLGIKENIESELTCKPRTGSHRSLLTCKEATLWSGTISL